MNFTIRGSWTRTPVWPMFQQFSQLDLGVKQGVGFVLLSSSSRTALYSLFTLDTVSKVLSPPPLLFSSFAKNSPALRSAQGFHDEGLFLKGSPTRAGKQSQAANFGRVIPRFSYARGEAEVNSVNFTTLNKVLLRARGCDGTKSHEVTLSDGSPTRAGKRRF